MSESFNTSFGGVLAGVSATVAAISLGAVSLTDQSPSHDLFALVGVVSVLGVALVMDDILDKSCARLNPRRYDESAFKHNYRELCRRIRLWSGGYFMFSASVTVLFYGLLVERTALAGVGPIPNLGGTLTVVYALVSATFLLLKMLTYQGDALFLAVTIVFGLVAALAG